MKKKKGFFATSLIYSFFLVFIMLMVTILARTTNNRILLNSLKRDIRNELSNAAGFIVDFLPNRAYVADELINFANENWRVLNASSATAPTVVLILDRALNKDDVENALRRVSTNTEFYNGTCNASGCQVRACRIAFSGQEFCYQYPSNTALRLKPSWAPSVAQVQNERYGKTIVSEVVNTWFDNHLGLKRVLNNNKLVRMTFSDGYMNTTGYVRLPKSSGENLNVTGLRPYHLIDSPNNETQIRIYNGTVSQVASNSSAYIRPVIEVRKG